MSGLLSAGKSLGSWLAGSGLGAKALSYAMPYLNKTFSKVHDKVVGEASKYGLGDEASKGLNNLFSKGKNAVGQQAQQWLDKKGFGNAFSNVGSLPATASRDDLVVPGGASVGTAYKDVLQNNVNKMFGKEDQQMQDRSGNQTAMQTA